MRRIVIVGGGLAGLSAAAFLVKNNFHVRIFEQSPKLGGRAYSFIDSESGDEIDNGQHLLLGCYKDTFEFASIINASENFIFEKKLSIPMATVAGQDYSGKIIYLEATSAPYPLSLFFGLLNFDALTFLERIKILELLAKIFFSNYNAAELTVEEFLENNGQSNNIKKYLWEILSIGSLNCKSRDASAEIFVRILREIFFTGGDASKFVIPKYGLSKSFCEPARKYLEGQGSEIFLSNGLQAAQNDGTKISSLQFDNSLNDYDDVIVAAPPFALNKITGLESLAQNEIFEYSPILTVHVWLNENHLKEKYYALIDSPVHWVFNHQKFVTIVISAAEEFVAMSEVEIFDLVWKELEIYLKLRKENLIRYKVLKEKRATFIPSKQILNRRPGVKTKFDNLFLAGDWIDTELPSTIESAVRSGKMAAEAVIQKYS